MITHSIENKVQVGDIDSNNVLTTRSCDHKQKYQVSTDLLKVPVPHRNVLGNIRGPRLQSGNTLASHL